MAGMDVWGQGAIFAFSGLEGKTDFQSQLVGVLLGDHVGVRFLAAQPFELYVDTTDVSELVWDIVASDVLAGKVRVQNLQLGADLVDGAVVHHHQFLVLDQFAGKIGVFGQEPQMFR